MPLDFSQGPVKTAQWQWEIDLISDPAKAVLSGALGVVPFWDGSGSARNVLENGWNDGTLVNAPWTVNEGGLAVQVDGDTDYVDFNVNFGGATEYTYLVVGKVTAEITTTERFFMAGQLQSNANGYDLGGPYFGSSNLGRAYFFPINGSIIGPGSHVFAENEIVAAICRYKSGETNGTQIWVNGVLDAQDTISGTPSSTYGFTLGLDWTAAGSNVDWQPMLFIPWGRALKAFECSYATRNWRDFIRPDPAKILPLFFAEQAGAGAGSILPAMLAHNHFNGGLAA